MVEWRYSSTHSYPRHYMEMNGQLNAHTALPTGKEPQLPLDRRLCGPQSRSGRDVEEKNPCQ